MLFSNTKACFSSSNCKDRKKNQIRTIYFYFNLRTSQKINSKHWKWNLKILVSIFLHYEFIGFVRFSRTSFIILQNMTPTLHVEGKRDRKKATDHLPDQIMWMNGKKTNIIKNIRERKLLRAMTAHVLKEDGT